MGFWTDLFKEVLVLFLKEKYPVLETAISFYENNGWICNTSNEQFKATLMKAGLLGEKYVKLHTAADGTVIAEESGFFGETREFKRPSSVPLPNIWLREIEKNSERREENTQNESNYSDDWSDENEEEDDITPLLLFIKMSAKISKHDGVVLKEHIEVISYFIDNLDLSDDQKKEAKREFNTAKNSSISILDYAKEFRSYNPPEEASTLLINLLFELASKGRGLTKEKEKVIRDVSKIINLSERVYTDLKSQYIENEDEIRRYYSILESNEGDSDEVIKKNYKRLILEYHPDKIHKHKLPPDYEKFANQKVKEITEAYEKIKAIRNMKD
ncbi:MAG: DnaJ domain-containing protein [Candidatus Cloacimonetes bacterium]|nr:DnaJ domain-containing protein [Candidatus Cloacimonadota bacterium]